MRAVCDRPRGSEEMLWLCSQEQGSASTSDTAAAHQSLGRENWSLEEKAQDKNEGLLLFRVQAGAVVIANV